MWTTGVGGLQWRCAQKCYPPPWRWLDANEAYWLNWLDAEVEEIVGSINAAGFPGKLTQCDEHRAGEAAQRAGLNHRYYPRSSTKIPSRASSKSHRDTVLGQGEKRACPRYMLSPKSTHKTFSAAVWISGGRSYKAQKCSYIRASHRMSCGLRRLRRDCPRRPQ